MPILHFIAFLFIIDGWQILAFDVMFSRACIQIPNLANRFAPSCPRKKATREETNSSLPRSARLLVPVAPGHRSGDRWVEEPRLSASTVVSSVWMAVTLVFGINFRLSRPHLDNAPRW